MNPVNHNERWYPSLSTVGEVGEMSKTMDSNSISTGAKPQAGKGLQDSWQGGTKSTF